MTKRQLIDEIITANQTAEPSFLAQFDDSDLREYLRHLRWAKLPRLTGNVRQYEKYFKSRSRVSTPQPAAVGGQAVEDPFPEAHMPVAAAAPAPPAEVDDDAAFDDLPEITEYRGRHDEVIQEEADADAEPLPLAAVATDADDHVELEAPLPFAKTDQPQEDPQEEPQQESDTQTWLF